jgi:hypothetical protein
MRTAMATSSISNGLTSILDSFEKGKVIARYFESAEELVNYRGGHLHQAERALLRLLKRKNNGHSRT